MGILNLVSIIDSEIDLAIVQGATYKKLILRLEGDHTNTIFKSEIRDKDLYSGGQLLASFTFNQINYDSSINKTTVVPFLSDTQTSQIPPTSYEGRGLPNSKQCWVWDLEALLEDGSKDKVIELSYVQVKKESTN